MTSARYTHPFHVKTYVMSATYNRSGDRVVARPARSPDRSATGCDLRVGLGEDRAGSARPRTLPCARRLTRSACLWAVERRVDLDGVGRERRRGPQRPAVSAATLDKSSWCTRFTSFVPLSGRHVGSRAWFEGVARARLGRPSGSPRSGMVAPGGLDAQVAQRTKHDGEPGGDRQQSSRGGGANWGGGGKAHDDAVRVGIGPCLWTTRGCPRPLERRRRSTCPSANEARARAPSHNDTSRAPVAEAAYEPGGSLFGARTRVTERYACTVSTGGSGPRRYSMQSPVRIVAPGASTAW